jgi:hypothetical protein
MTRLSLLLAASAGLAFAVPAHAQRYIGVETLHSSDADLTDVAKWTLSLDFSHADPAHYQGLALETARFTLAGQRDVEEHRAFYRFAGGDTWKWTGRVGSDGHGVLGSASIHNGAERRQEYFVERDIIETPLGLQHRSYSTYAGGAFDLPFDQRTLLTTVVGVQDFGGDNLRLHYRGNLSYSIAPRHGLSAQLRVRYFRDSDPNESDYFAPGWYAQAMPTLQLRRYHEGWRYAVAAGYGRQRATDSSWRTARLLEASVTSPEDRDWVLRAGFTYTDTPVNSGFAYDYRRVFLSLGRVF